MRASRNREVVVRLHVDDENGELVDATGTPTIAVTDYLGVVVADVSAVTTEGVGIYRATIPPQASISTLSVIWSAVVSGNTRIYRDQVRITAGRLVPLWRLRDDSEMAPLDGDSLLRCLEVVEDWFKDALGFPPVEEMGRRAFNHLGGARLRVPGVWYPKTVLSVLDNSRTVGLSSVSIVDAAFEFAVSSGWSFISGSEAGHWAAGRKEVVFTYGGPWDQPPEDLVRAAVVLCRYVARQTNYPERARSVQTEGAIINFSTPSFDRPTGLPEVDGVLSRYKVSNAF